MSVFKEEREQKFISVYHSYVSEIYQYVYLRTGMKKALAEDITQDIFMDVYRGMSGFKGLSSERTWIFKIARNKLSSIALNLRWLRLMIIWQSISKTHPKIYRSF